MLAFENHDEWPAVKETIERLHGAGHRALLAGGCVRDLLMGRRPNDFDIATSATPDQVEALFTNSIAVGKQFGVIILPFGTFQVEVATFREDLEYRDGRRPEGVSFSTPEADAKRRDFTINALFYDTDTSEIVDYVDGRADLNRRLIRTVGEPDRRFDEDKLRLLRAVRFSAQLGFEIESETLKAVKRRAADVTVVSRERIRDELMKLLSAAGRLSGAELLIQTGLLAAILPDLAEIPDLYSRMSRSGLGFEESSLQVRLALFLAPLYFSIDIARFSDLCIRGLKLSNDLGTDLLFIYKSAAVFQAPEAQRVGELALLLAEPQSLDAVEFTALYHGHFRADYLTNIRERCLTDGGQLPKSFLTGNDVRTAGVKPGPEMGRILKEAQLLQLEGTLSDRDAALRWLSETAKV